MVAGLWPGTSSFLVLCHVRVRDTAEIARKDINEPVDIVPADDILTGYPLLLEPADKLRTEDVDLAMKDTTPITETLLFVLEFGEERPQVFVRLVLQIEKSLVGPTGIRTHTTPPNGNVSEHRNNPILAVGPGTHTFNLKDTLTVRHGPQT